MNCDIKLTAEEFKVLHNSLCDLNRFCQFKEIEEIVERIRRVALKSAYEQEDQAFTSKHDYYREFQEQNKFRSIWSVYELNAPSGFQEEHPYKDAEFVIYDQHWGDSGDITVPIQGNTWADLYRAAEEAIRVSGDGHHVFIESFHPINGRLGCLRLSTGS